MLHVLTTRITKLVIFFSPNKAQLLFMRTHTKNPLYKNLVNLEKCATNTKRPSFKSGKLSPYWITEIQINSLNRLFFSKTHFSMQVTHGVGRSRRMEGEEQNTGDQHERRGSTVIGWRGVFSGRRGLTWKCDPWSQAGLAKWPCQLMYPCDSFDGRILCPCRGVIWSTILSAGKRTRVWIVFYGFIEGLMGCSEAHPHGFDSPPQEVPLPAKKNRKKKMRPIILLRYFQS